MNHDRSDSSPADPAVPQAVPQGDRDIPAPEYASPPAPASVGLGARAMQGVRISAAIAVMSKLASSGAQIALGFLLVKEQWGTYAAAVSIFGLFAAMRDGGANRFLIRHIDEVERLGRAGKWLAIGANTLALCGMLGFALVSESLTGNRGVFWLVLILGASMVLESWLLLPRALIAGQMLWRRTLTMEIVTTFARYGAAILLAIIGFGAASLAVPWLLVAVVTIIMIRRLVAIPPLEPVSRGSVKQLIGAAKWLLIGNLGLALAIQGDYLVLEFVESRAVLGDYFFGFQLTTPVALLFTASFSSVLLPSLNAARQDPDRFRRGTLRAIELITPCVALAGLFLAVTSPVLIHVIWSGYWDRAIPAAVLISLSTMFTVPAAATYSIIEALGMWRFRSVLLIADGLGVMAAAFAGAMLGEVLAIAACVAGYRSASSLILVLLGARLGGVPAWAMTGRYLLPTGISLVSFASGWLACIVAGQTLFDWAGAAILIGLSGLVSLVLNILFLRRRLIDAIALFTPGAMRGLPILRQIIAKAQRLERQ